MLQRTFQEVVYGIKQSIHGLEGTPFFFVCVCVRESKSQILSPAHKQAQNKFLVRPQVFRPSVKTLEKANGEEIVKENLWPTVTTSLKITVAYTLEEK